MNSLQKILLVFVAVEAVALGALRLGKFTGHPLPEVRKDALSAEVGHELTRMEQTLRPDQAEDWWRLGESYRACNLLDAAAHCFGEADRLAPGNAEWIFERAVTLSRMGNNETAAPLLERAIAGGSIRANEARLILARDRLREDDLAGAEKRLRELKDSPDAVLLLTRLLSRTGRGREARTILDGWLQAAPDDLRARQMRSWVAAEMGNPAEAEAHRLRALRAQGWAHRDNPASARDEHIRQQFPREKILARAQTLETQAKWHEAAAAWREALKIYWTEEDALRVVNCELNAARPAVAITELQRLIDTSGASGENLLLLGRAWLADGNMQQAWEAGRKAEQLGANQSTMGNLQIEQFLSDLATQRDDPDTARIHQARAQFELGKLSWFENNVAQAHQQFLRATTLWPQHAHAWFYRAETSVLLGQRAAARQSYERCLTLAPHHGRAVAALARLQKQP